MAPAAIAVTSPTAETSIATPAVLPSTAITDPYFECRYKCSSNMRFNESVPEPAVTLRRAVAVVVLGANQMSTRARRWDFARAADSHVAFQTWRALFCLSASPETPASEGRKDRVPPPSISWRKKCMPALTCAKRLGYSIALATAFYYCVYQLRRIDVSSPFMSAANSGRSGVETIRHHGFRMAVTPTLDDRKTRREETFLCSHVAK